MKTVEASACQWADEVSAKEYRVVDCASCGFWHVHPYPTLEFLEEFYQGEYKMKFPPFALELLAEKTDRLTPEAKTVLDVGCGGGELLELLAARGWTCYGIEPSHDYSEAARQKGLQVVRGNIFGELPDLPKTDVVILDNVVEHLPHPKRYLSAIVETYLKPGGSLLIQVPNDFNPLQRSYAQVHGTGAYWCHPPAHLNYFTREAITRFVEGCGLTVTRTEQDFPMELFLLMGRDYLSDPAVGRQCHAMRTALHDHCKRSGQPELLEAFFEAMARLDWGRVTTLYATKP